MGIHDALDDRTAQPHAFHAVAEEGLENGGLGALLHPWAGILELDLDKVLEVADLGFDVLGLIHHPR